MNYGFFDDKNKEYVITTPNTPLPWINYLGQNDFFSLISNTGGGYSFYKDARLRRITRFRYNNVPRDTGGRMYYINDGSDIWSPSFSPAKADLDHYECRHGMGYTTFATEKNKLASKLTAFVPLGENAEINLLTFTNHSDEEKKFNVISAVEWCLWDAEDDQQNFQRNLSIGEVEIEDNTIYHKTEYRERRDHYAFSSVNAETVGYDTDRDSFLGDVNRGWDNPLVVENAKSTNSVAHGWAPIASHNNEIVLAAGESTSLIYILGYVENPQEEKFDSLNVINKKQAREIIEKYSTQEKVEEALEELATYWDDLLSNYQVESNEAELDRMVNIWNQYQNMVTFNLSRSASYFESGIGRGMGFRDSNQDLLGFIHMVPDRARERILDIASTQKEDGSAWHQYQPLTKMGNANIGGGFNDDPLWLIASVDAYLRETGDSSILTEEIPFNNEPGTEVTLLEHLSRSMQYIQNNKGAHNLALIGRADWNDCLNLNAFSNDPSESFQTTKGYVDNERIAESVLISEMYILYGKSYLDLLRTFPETARFNVEEEIARFEKELADMEAAINKHAWDGEWYLRAYDANSDKVGSFDNEDGKIFIESQVFAVMAGLGREDGKAEKALTSVRKHLTTEYGTCLVWPAYKEYHLELGEISSYPPGYKENGGIFCHTNPWLAIAHAEIGDAEEAFNVYRRISPAYTEKNSALKKTEPYVYCQMIAGQEATNYGEGKNSWLTGTAAWNFVAVSQNILGIYPGHNGLILKPCLPDKFADIKITRKYRGKEYRIHMVKGDTNKLTVDGNIVEGNTIPILDKDIIEVEYIYT